MDKIRKAFTLFLILIIAMLSLTFLTVKADSNQPITFSSGLTLYSPINTTYNSNVVECNGTFNWPKPSQVSLNYSIDGEDQGALLWSLDVNSISIPEYSTIAGSFQLPQLPNGPHQLSVGIDEELYNNTGSAHELINQTTWVNTVYFTISANQPTPTPTPTVPELTYCTLPSVVIFGIITALSLVFKKVGHPFEGQDACADGA